MLKSEEEYTATAMLLGMEYAADVHAFYFNLFEGRVRLTTENPWLDADTMEPLDDDEWHKRFARSIGGPYP